MSKLSYIDFNNVDVEELPRFLAMFTLSVKNILNNGALFADNFNCKIQSVTFSAANTEVNVTHNLGRKPSGYLVLTRSANAVIYDGTTENSDSSLFLRASAAVTCSIMIF